jgi:ADP-ribose pyrophosphatase
MYDGSVCTFERVRYKDGAFTIGVDTAGHILLTRQEQPAKEPFLSLPGGALEDNEDPLDGAKREFLEETGYTSSAWSHYTTSSGSANVICYTYFYVARDCVCTADIQPDGGEKIEVYTVTFDEFLLLSSDKKFHHWNVVPILYEARLNTDARAALHMAIYGKEEHVV